MKRETDRFLDMDIVYGRHSVAAVFEGDKDLIEKIWVQRGLHFSGHIADGIRDSVRMGAVLQYVDRAALDRLTNRANHQGLALRTSLVSFLDLHGWLQNLTTGPLIVLILDGIQDPGNLGAIFRTASAAGVNAIVLPKRGSAPLGGIAMKASAGTLNSVPVIKITNVRSTIDTLKKKGFHITGISEKADRTIIDLPVLDKTAYVFGSENRGIRPLNIRDCDDVRAIPMMGPAKSLNVSAAVAIVLYERVRSGVSGKKLISKNA